MPRPNDRGHVGGTTSRRYARVPVPCAGGVTQVSATEQNSYAPRADHTVLAWGENALGATADGTSYINPPAGSGPVGVFNDERDSDS
jgi:alpha-tubulin suppressor-like RCC1 family protein